MLNLAWSWLSAANVLRFSFVEKKFRLMVRPSTSRRVGPAPVVVKPAGLHLDIVELIVQVAHVLPHREDVVEAVLEFVAERCLLVFQALIVEVAAEEIPRDLTEGAGHQRALDRQQRKRATLRVLPVARQEGDGGVDIRPPGPGRRDRESLLADIIDLGVGVETDAGDAVEQRLVLVDGAADVERALDAVERAVCSETHRRDFRSGAC